MKFHFVTCLIFMILLYPDDGHGNKEIQKKSRLKHISTKVYKPSRAMLAKYLRMIPPRFPPTIIHTRLRQFLDKEKLKLDPIHVNKEPIKIRRPIKQATKIRTSQKPSKNKVFNSRPWRKITGHTAKLNRLNIPSTKPIFRHTAAPRLVPATKLINEPIRGVNIITTTSTTPDQSTTLKFIERRKPFVPPQPQKPMAIPKPRVNKLKEVSTVFPPSIINVNEPNVPTHKLKVPTPKPVRVWHQPTSTPKMGRPNKPSFTRKPPNTLPPIILIRPRPQIDIVTQPPTRYQPMTVKPKTTLPPIVVPPVQTALFEEAPRSPILIDNSIKKVAIAKAVPSTNDTDDGQQPRTRPIYSTTTSKTKTTKHISRADVDPIPTMVPKVISSTRPQIVKITTTTNVPKNVPTTTANVRSTTSKPNFVTFKPEVTTFVGENYPKFVQTTQPLVTSSTEKTINTWDDLINLLTDALISNPAPTNSDTKTHDVTSVSSGSVQVSHSTDVPFTSSSDSKIPTEGKQTTVTTHNVLDYQTTTVQSNVKTFTNDITSPITRTIDNKAFRQEVTTSANERTTSKVRTMSPVSSTTHPKYTYLFDISMPKRRTTTTVPKATTTKRTDNIHATTEKIHMDHSLKVMGIPLSLDMIGEHPRSTTQQTRTLNGPFVHVPTQSYKVSRYEVPTTTFPPIEVKTLPLGPGYVVKTDITTISTTPDKYLDSTTTEHYVDTTTTSTTTEPNTTIITTTEPTTTTTTTTEPTTTTSTTTEPTTTTSTTTEPTTTTSTTTEPTTTTSTTTEPTTTTSTTTEPTTTTSTTTEPTTTTSTTTEPSTTTSTTTEPTTTTSTTTEPTTSTSTTTEPTTTTSTTTEPTTTTSTTTEPTTTTSTTTEPTTTTSTTTEPTTTTSTTTEPTTTTSTTTEPTTTTSSTTEPTTTSSTTTEPYLDTTTTELNVGSTTSTTPYTESSTSATTSEAYITSTTSFPEEPQEETIPSSTTSLSYETSTGVPGTNILEVNSTGLPSESTGHIASDQNETLEHTTRSTDDNNGTSTMIYDKTTSEASNIVSAVTEELIFTKPVSTEFSSTEATTKMDVPLVEASSTAVSTEQSETSTATTSYMSNVVETTTENVIRVTQPQECVIVGCPRGLQCVTVNFTICDDTQSADQCSCKPGCSLGNVYIALGQPVVTDRCGNLCYCSKTGLTACTKIPCNKEKYQRTTPNPFKPVKFKPDVKDRGPTRGDSPYFYVDENQSKSVKVHGLHFPDQLLAWLSPFSSEFRESLPSAGIREISLQDLFKT